MRAANIVFHLALEIKRYMRDRTGAFWTFVFPFLMLFLFMWMYGGNRFGMTNNYLVTGMVGMTVLATCLFGFSVVLVELRSRDVFKMFHIFPLRKLEYLSAFILSRVVILVSFCLLYTAVAHGLYGIDLRLDALQFAALAAILLLGSACFLAIGLAMSSRLSTVTAATAVTNLVYFPMIFLSDLFYPQGELPGWIGAFMKLLPLTPFVDSLRAVIAPSIEWKALTTPALNMLAWTGGSVLLATVFFRWQNPSR
jgi:ABC-type polysaccharide/polyol phosphate export permease